MSTRPALFFPRFWPSGRSRAITWMLLNVLLWGMALPISKYAVGDTTPFQFLLGRYFFAIVLSLPVLAYFCRRSSLWSSLPKIIGLELIGTTLALGLLYEGLSRTTSLEAGLIATTTPLFTTLGGILYLKEREDRHEWLGLAIAVSGTLLLAVEPLLTGRSSEASFSFFGNVLVFLQNIATAIYFVLAKKYYKGLPKFWITTVSFYVGFISFFVLSVFSLQLSPLQLATRTIQEWQHFSVLGPVLYMAFFGSILGLTAYIQGQDGMEASEASLSSYLQPLVYVPLAYLLWNESINRWMAVAIVCIFVGVIIGEWQPRRRARKQTGKTKRPR